MFQDPSFFRDGTRWDYSKGYVLREKYLSGDVMEKYRIAREMDLQYPGCFQPNIEELEKLPYDVQNEPNAGLRYNGCV